MKSNELRQMGPCLICHQLIGRCPLPIFHIIEMKRLGLEPGLELGLEQVLGGSATLAQAMGPDEDMTIELATAKVMVCDGCFIERLAGLFVAYEDPEGGPGKCR